MSLLSSDFDGLLDEDFDVYRRECWSSNLHNLGRMKTKEKVVSLAKSLENIFAGSELKLGASSEIPSVWNGREVQDQWAYYLRNETAQRTLQPVLQRRLDLASRVSAPADHFKHLFFGVRLSEDAIGVGLRLSRYASIDVANLPGKAETDLQGLTNTLKDLPEDITLDGSAVSADGLLKASHELLTGEREWVDIARRIHRDDALNAGVQLAELLGDVAHALCPLMEYILWSAENDHVGVQEEISTFAQQTEDRNAAQKAEQERKAEAAAERAEKARERTSSKVAAEDAWRRMQAQRRAEKATPSPPSDSTQSEKARRRPSRAPAAEASNGRTSKGTSNGQRTDASKAKRPSAQKGPKKSAASRKAKGPAPTFEVGQVCQLTRGLFAGKTGEVVGSDKAGYYTVKVGVLEVNMSAYDIQIAD